MAQILRQSTSKKVRIGPVVAVANGYVPVTTLTIAGADEAEVLKANGLATVAMTGTLAAVTNADGWYDYTLAVGDVDTVGDMTIAINDDSLCLPVMARFQVVEEAVYDARYAASATPATGLNDVSTTDLNTACDTVTVTSMAANVLTAAAINAAALDGKGNWNIGKTGYSLSQAFPSNFADMSITVTTGRVDVASVAGTAQTANDNGADINLILDDTNELQTDNVPGLIGALKNFDPAADTVARVTLTDATTTNTDMRGTDGAAAALALAIAQTDLDTLTGSDGATLATTQANYAPATSTALATVDSNVDAVKAKTDALTFTATNFLQSDVQYVNAVLLTGTGVTGDEWGP